jgi:PAS domain S-box-containing protein
VAATNKKTAWHGVLSIPLLLGLLMLGSWFLLSSLTVDNARDNATASARATVSHFKKIREYYTSHVISKVLRDGNLEPTVDHKTNPRGVPLPATLVHDLSALMAHEDTSLNLYSTFPFPNRRERQLDEFQTEAWDFLVRNPDDIFTRDMAVDGKRVVRVAIADRMVTRDCVSCHNSHPDTPKNDWKLGDVRGVLEVDTVIDSQIARGTSQSSMILGFIAATFFIILAVVGLYLRSASIRAQTVERLVSERTDELAIATKALQASENFVRAIVETVVDGIITIDAEGIIQSLNPAAERIFGYSASEALGQNVKILMPEPYRGEHDSYIRNYHETGDAKIIGSGREVEGCRKDGSVFPVDLAVSEMHMDGRRMFTGIARDITDRKQAEQAKTEFISTVSHELRTPLTSIKGSLGLMKAGVAGPVPDEVHDLLKIAYDNSDRLVRLINDMLDIEKIAVGKMEFRMAPLDLSELVELAITSNKGYGEVHDVTFALTDTLPEAVVSGDTDRLMQVLANLMSNAAKFSPAGGQVDLSLTRVGESFRVAVRDRGPGIPEDYRDRVFEKFSQADSSDTRQKGGTGLGLSICKAIVDGHGGKLRFETKARGGTTFYFELPEGSQVDGAVAAAPAESRSQVG